MSLWLTSATKEEYEEAMSDRSHSGYHDRFADLDKFVESGLAYATVWPDSDEYSSVENLARSLKCASENPNFDLPVRVEFRQGVIWFVRTDLE